MALRNRSINPAHLHDPTTAGGLRPNRCSTWPEKADNGLTPHPLVTGNDRTPRDPLYQAPCTAITRTASTPLSGTRLPIGHIAGHHKNTDISSTRAVPRGRRRGAPYAAKAGRRRPGSPRAGETGRDTSSSGCGPGHRALSGAGAPAHRCEDADVQPGSTIPRRPMVLCFGVRDRWAVIRFPVSRSATTTLSLTVCTRCSP